MREIEPESFKVYQLAELEPEAREKAIAGVAEKLGGDWWEQSDNDDITAVITAKLAELLGTPEWAEKSVCDVQIPGVKVEGWDLERGDSLDLRGVLDRDNAPALLWADGVTEVVLVATRWNGTDIEVRWDEDDRDPDQERDLTVVRMECQELAEKVEATVEAAIHGAKLAGRAELDYKTSAEYAREEIEANEREFYADGSLYG